MLNVKWLLIVTAISINLTAVYVFLNPNGSNHSVADFKFPLQIELPSGTAIAKDNFQVDTAFGEEFSVTKKLHNHTINARQKYNYTSDRLPINLEINYLVDTRGDVQSYLRQYTKLPHKAIAKGKIEYIEEVGYHLLVTTSDRAYLSSCISPRSLSNITQKQFTAYRYQNDLKWYLLWEWLQRKASIRDRRCLWVNLSTPLVSDPKSAYQALETTWKELYFWWLPNFPSLME